MVDRHLALSLSFTNNDLKTTGLMLKYKNKDPPSIGFMRDTNSLSVCSEVGRCPQTQAFIQTSYSLKAHGRKGKTSPLISKGIFLGQLYIHSCITPQRFYPFYNADISRLSSIPLCLIIKPKTILELTPKVHLEGFM